MNNAASVIFAHNHPSGVPNRAAPTRLLTQTLKQALALVDVRVLDHFIVAGARRRTSLRRMGTYLICGVQRPARGVAPVIASAAPHIS